MNVATSELEKVGPPTTAGPQPHTSPLHASVKKLFVRPELPALVGAAATFLFFMAVAEPFRSMDSLSTVLYLSSTYGIMTVTVGLLLIAGEFDLSTGVVVTTASLVAAQVAFMADVNVWVGGAISLFVVVGIGLFNGYLVIKTSIPSFLITLGTFLMISGLNVALTKTFTGRVSSDNISGLPGYDSAKAIFASKFSLGGFAINITVIYWIVLVILGAWLLQRTRFGNWIFAVGGDNEAARAVGVPVPTMKITLYVAVAVTAWVIGMHNVFNFTTVQASSGVQNQFIWIIAVVIGGCLLDGGYGSVFGTAAGAFIFGVASLGIVYAGWEANYFMFFLGAMLLLATFLNNVVRSYVSRKQ